jgi:microsomal dipeptidase-like Zn-dependent dipeptidase
MIVDLHAHYPMHVVSGGRTSLWRLLLSRRGRRRLRNLVRALLVGIASRFANYRSFFSGPRVRVKYMQEGQVGVALSVLYSFFDEIDALNGTLPEASYADNLEEQLDTVQAHVAAEHGNEVIVATSPQQLSAAGRQGKLALVHCVEGGFHLGGSPKQVRATVGRLAKRGVAYITLAHLIWREVATDAPALPFMSDAEYRDLFPQPDEGLSDLGRAAVEAMVREHVLIDLSHMSERSLRDTFELLDELDPDRSVPVLATHAGYRFGSQEYMLDAATIERIAARNGAIGLIFARHQIEDGLPGAGGRRPRLSKQRRFEASFETLCRHIDEIHRISGSHRHAAIGSDLDGFIKPTLPGLDDMRDMRRLEHALRRRYGDEDAELICSGNALRLLSTYWQGSSEVS